MRTIVWDLDDVLNNLMETWFNQAWLPAHSECQLSYNDIRENPPHRVLGIQESEYLSSLDIFRKSSAAAAMSPNHAVLEWLDRYGPRFRHVVLTARPLESVPEAAAWVFRHFGAFVRCFGFVPSRPARTIPKYDCDKGDFIQWLGQADFFVDDSERNIAIAQELGIGSVLYPRPWNSARLTDCDPLQLLTRSAEAN